MQIRITSVNELIDFIQSYELPFEKYLEIVQAYIGRKFIWTGKEDKKSLISEIQRLKTEIVNNWEIPLFWDFEFPE